MGTNVRRIAIWVLGLLASAILGMLAAGPPNDLTGFLGFHRFLVQYPAKPIWGAVGGVAAFACARLWFEDWRADT